MYHNFFLILPKFYIETILLPQTNDTVKGDPLSFGEFPWFIGLWLFTTFLPVYNRGFFWERSIAIFEGAPIRLNIFMAGNRFENIITALLFTDLPSPYFKDKLFGILRMIFAWNYHIKGVFIPSWVSFLDESISICNNKFT